MFDTPFETRLREQLIRHEGLRLKPYTDTVGKLTIGVGRNLADVGISAEEAYYLLDRDIGAATTMLDSHLPWFKSLDEVRRAVLIDMCFNMGWLTLSTFHGTLAAIEGHEFDQASAHMLDSKWATQVGVRATRLAMMMRSGQWPETLTA